MQSFCAARYRKADSTPCPIVQGLYLGSIGAALNKDALKSLNITHILIVARSLSPAFPAEFNYKKIEVLDSLDTDLLKHFDECFSFIDEGISSGGNVLVHCFAGRSRSVTIVVAYLMKKHQMSLESALSLVRSKRLQVAPNEGFISQLENFEKSLQDAQSWIQIVPLKMLKLPAAVIGGMTPISGTTNSRRGRARLPTSIPSDVLRVLMP
ncbi:unnamed protein product [Urochloa decumbens]|uniref:Protein-tyrosine-phosphatase n=1 Tax=Urochloa decumbens TaxID=240449 RepID=A0ABC8Z9Y7_9POAL